MSSLGTRTALWRARRHGVTGFVSQPEPKTRGEAARGRQLLAGRLNFAGELVELEGRSPWTVTPPSPDFSAALHGFAWLDDLAAVGSKAAPGLGQKWVQDWTNQFGTGHGPGWEPWLTGRRQMRWITHAISLMNGLSSAETAQFIDLMGRQALFLDRNWHRTRAGFSRCEALTGFVHSAAALSGLEHHLPRALKALAGVLDQDIDAKGSIPSRNPEELLEIFSLLTWTADVMRDSGNPSDPALDTAIARIAPVLRSLRHADGGLARFQGGGRGRPGLLDLALRQSRLRPSLTKGLAMGYGRLAAETVTVLTDAAPPLLGEGSGRAHASSLAIQMTSGRQPILVSSGAGMRFGAELRQAARATPSHSTLVLQGYSSARMARQGTAFTEGPQEVTCEAQFMGSAETLLLSHDGWAGTHGLTHLRSLTLAGDGRMLHGEDSLAALAPDHRARLDKVLLHTAGTGLDYRLHFHLHPDIRAELDMGGQAVSLTAPNREVWVLRAKANEDQTPMTLAIAPSIYLDSRHITPRATKQVVLTSRLTGYASAVHWSLACPLGPPPRRRTPAPMIL